MTLKVTDGPTDRLTDTTWPVVPVITTDHFIPSRWSFYTLIGEGQTRYNCRLHCSR